MQGSKLIALLGIGAVEGILKLRADVEVDHVDAESLPNVEVKTEPTTPPLPVEESKSVRSRFSSLILLLKR